MVAACSFGDGTVASCATSLTGSFESTGTNDQAYEGLVAAQLEYLEDTDAWQIEGYFYPESIGDTEAAPVRLRAYVEEDGTVTPVAGSHALSGSVDLDTCAIEDGVAMFTNFYGTGSFELSPP
ncbi:hypothetical protein Hoch_4598 [Haliangium ochraceum DSM 14365]|uniref:Uncharacterized protein n=2 Tax=Haliangium ochraceum TaxID=80816 RepID=D0LQ52_HALO1|nr:hypothetical protein Hoch_4598 [Haliangium ochraceum DSM 14365]